MLSILIPAYRWPVSDLVSGLHRQATEMGIPFEIRVYDDASGYDYAKELSWLLESDELILRVMPVNLGRSAIRNKLARDARYPWLLFIDADSKLTSSGYLSLYWKQRDEHLILAGGTAYANEPPSDPRRYFRWHYGRNREARTVQDRALHPFEGFTTHHFLCHATVFEKVQFPEHVRTYGHEDTLFGIELKKAGIGIKHLENPLLHTGLETTPQYLAKTREALESLCTLRLQQPALHTRLSHTYTRLHRYRLAPLLRLFHKLTESMILRNLNGSRPSLLLFDLYRLGYYARICAR